LKKRYLILDYLRAFSAVLVILYHYTVRYHELYGDNIANSCFIFKNGFMAIAVFFILSGFLITENIENDKSMINFVFKRFVRLYPSYWVCVIITSIVCFYLLPDKVLSLKEIIINLSMFEGFFGIKYVDGAYWTLRVELLFYAFISFIIFFNLREYLIYILFFIVSVSLACNLFNSQYFIIKLYKYLFPPQYIHMFISGMIISLYNKSKKELVKRKLIYIIIILLSIINQFISHGGIYTIAFLLFMFSIICFIKLFPDYSIPKSFLGVSIQWVAKVSYPLYLIHQYFGYAIIKYLYGFGYYSNIILIIPIFLSIFVASLIYKFIEVPFAKKMRSFQEYYLNKKNINRIRM